MAYGYPTYGGYGQMPAMQQAYAQGGYAQQMQPAMQMMPQQAQPAVNVRLVTSREEATTAQIPFDNTINVFLNLGADEVYVKRFNPVTGGAMFGDYIMPSRTQQAAQDAEKPQQEYATVDMLAALERRVDELIEASATKRSARGGKADE